MEQINISEEERRNQRIKEREEIVIKRQAEREAQRNARLGIQSKEEAQKSELRITLLEEEVNSLKEKLTKLIEVTATTIETPVAETKPAPDISAEIAPEII